MVRSSSMHWITCAFDRCVCHIGIGHHGEVVKVRAYNISRRSHEALGTVTSIFNVQVPLIIQIMKISHGESECEKVEIFAT